MVSKYWNLEIKINSLGLSVLTMHGQFLDDKNITSYIVKAPPTPRILHQPPHHRRGHHSHVHIDGSSCTLPELIYPTRLNKFQPDPTRPD
jgi:hypothetical protein